MIHVPVKQGSSEWLLERYGIPTASCASNIITPAKGEKSKSWDTYISELIAERHAKAQFNDAEQIEYMLNRTKTDSMSYGNEMEPRAASAYEFLTGRELTEAGFMLNDERTAGASLDRLVVGEKRGVEFKCPYSFNVHVGYCLSRNIEIDKRPQLQWQLWISGLDGIDICAYYPGAITVIVPVERDEEYIAKIAEFHAEFYQRLEQRWAEWQTMQPKDQLSILNK